MQQCRLELPSPCLTKTRRTPWNLTNTSPHSPSSLSTLESLTIIPCWSGSFMALIYRLQYSSPFLEQSKPPPSWKNFTPNPLRIKEVTTALPHSGEDPNAMDMDCLTLSLVEHTHHMCKNHCFIYHKEGHSTRNHPGYNCGCPTGSWCINLKPSQTAHVRAISTTSHSTPSSSHQDVPLDSFLKDVIKTQGRD